MRCSFLATTFALLVGALFVTAQPAAPPAQAQPEAKAPPAAAAAKPVKDVVDSFYSNLAAGKIKDNEALLRTTEISISGTYRGNGNAKARAWAKSPAQYFAMHGDKPKYLKVDSVEVDLAHPALAVARVRYHQGGQKAYAVVTLALEEKVWKVTSLYEETHFVW